MRLDVIALVNGTCKIDGIVLIAMDAEDLLGTRLDLPDEVHQLPAIGMTGKTVDSDNLEVNRDRPLPPHRDLTPPFLYPAPVRSICLVTDKDKGVLLVLCKVQEIFHHRSAVQHTAGRDDHAGITGNDLFPQFLAVHLLETLGKERVHTLAEDQVSEFGIW